MQSTINNFNNYKNNTSSEGGMSICIPRAFANITEARVRKVFEKLGIFSISRVDMIQRKNEKGDAYQRIFVHIQDWTETADAQKAKELLLSGKELKIVYDDPWFWKASLNTWTPKPKPETSMYDRKPRIRLEFEDQDTANVDAAAALMNSISLEDQRPYAERRIDPSYCEQDVASGFRDRREPKNRDRPRKDSRFSNRSPPRDNHKENEKKKDKPLITSPKPQEPPLVIAAALPEIEKIAYKMDPEITRLMSIYFKIGKSDVTEEFYKNNAQMIRDMRRDEIDAQQDTEEYKASLINYSGCAPAPKRKQRKIIVEEEKTNA